MMKLKYMHHVTWASLATMFKQIDLIDTHGLYIGSDSPTSQYRNKKNVFLTKQQWAIENNIEIYWIFTVKAQRMEWVQQ